MNLFFFFTSRIFHSLCCHGKMTTGKVRFSILSVGGHLFEQ